MLFLQKQYQYFSRYFSSVVDWKSVMFENQESVIYLEKAVKLQPCIVVGSLTASAQEAIELLQLLHTLKNSGASEVTLFSPYWGYQRQDRHRDGKLYGLLWSDAMLQASGVDRLLTVDAHTSCVSKCGVQIENVSSSVLFIDMIDFFIGQKYSFAFPDQSAQIRAKNILNIYPQILVGVFEKQRLSNDIRMNSFQGQVSSKVIIFDDILDSGQTLFQACIALKQLQVQEIVVIVTHAFFHGDTYKELFKLGVKKIICTDSVPQVKQHVSDYVQVISIAPLVQKNVF